MLLKKTIKDKEKSPMKIFENIKNMIIKNYTNYDEYFKSIKNELEIMNKNYKSSYQKKWLCLVFKLFYIKPYVLKSCNSFYMDFGYNKNDIIFEVKCYDPSIIFKDICNLGASTIIMTSGSLSPISSFERDLNHKFEISFTNQHVLPKENSLVCLFSKNFRPWSFNFSYEKRTKEQLARLCKIIVEISENVPNGLICYFQNYSIISQFIEIFTKLDLLRLLRKRLFIETESGIADFDILLYWRKNQLLLKISIQYLMMMHYYWLYTEEN